MGQLAIDNPVVVVRSDDLSIIISTHSVDDPMAPAQTWEPDNGYSDVKPLGVWLKFLYYLEEVNPPQPWSEPNAG